MQSGLNRELGAFSLHSPITLWCRSDEVTMPGCKLVFGAPTAPQFTSFTNAFFMQSTNTAARPLNSRSVAVVASIDEDPRVGYLGHVEVLHWLSHQNPRNSDYRARKQQRQSVRMMSQSEKPNPSSTNPKCKPQRFYTLQCQPIVYTFTHLSSKAC